MKLLQEKLAKYDAPQRAMAAGIYPYFRMIESDQDTEVTISGKKVLMFGSNAYLGLTNHPKVKEAAIEAIKKYGTGCAGSRFLNGTLDLHVQLEKRMTDFASHVTETIQCIMSQFPQMFDTFRFVQYDIKSCIGGSRSSRRIAGTEDIRT